ncbi:MAG TPA: hypothetical protein VHK70_02040 [Burkholderiaceae bacterium]|jgi:hypothetical protein|nr:hypothetical protein [Burkholderiaceae bacterium]
MHRHTVSCFARNYRPGRAALLAGLLAAACALPVSAAGHAAPDDTNPAAPPARALNSTYEQLVIMSPADESTVFDNSGRVPVQILVSPVLALNPGDRVELFLDGRPVARQAGKPFELEGVVRGTHRLDARIVDATGAVVIEANPVTFYMWQASRLFPSRQ